MALRGTDENLNRSVRVSFMPPCLIECAEMLDPNFIGSFTERGALDNFPGEPGITSVDDFDYNPAYGDDPNTPLAYDMPFTKEELLAKYQEQFAAYEAAEVTRLKRKFEYPGIGEQLDALFHDMENGTADASGEFFRLIKEVKDTYPKG